MTLFALPALFSLWLLAGAQSKDIRFAAAEVAGTISVTQQTVGLRQEVQYFLAAMRDASGDRRRYERHEVAGSVALRLGGSDTPGSLADISLGGCAIVTRLMCAAGTGLSLIAPGATEPVSTRVAHAGDGALGVFFRRDDVSRRVVGAAIDRLIPVLQKAA